MLSPLSFSMGELKTMKPELLAPAGSYEALRAALMAGADAVYIGGSKFGARAYADNPDENELLSAIDEVHLYGKKLYLTVNTLLKQNELDKELYHYLKPCYEHGLDAVIVQDYGVLYQIRKWFPDLAIHCSTQMTITGPAGARLLEEAGVKRIVTARELSLNEIRKTADCSNIEIESFIHGALCYCYSGQCLFSSLIGGRSGNRGRCAQPCRLPFKVSENGRQISDTKNSYTLNTKDMCTIELLPDIIKAGVTSLKIEGRMKKPEYTAGVVQIYRKYLDLYLKDSDHYKVDPHDLTILFSLYNRDGFNSGYYKKRNGPDMMALRNQKKDPKKTKIKEISQKEQLYNHIHEQYSGKRPQKNIRGTLTLYPGVPATLILYLSECVVTVEKEGVQTAKNQPLSEERVRKQLMKTGETPFIFEDLAVFMGDDVFVPIQFLNEIKRDALNRLEQELLITFRRSAPDFNTPEFFPISCQDKKSPVITASVEKAEQLKALMQIEEITDLYLGYQMFRTDRFYSQLTRCIEELSALGKNVYLSLPHIVRADDLSYMEPYLEQLIQRGLSGFLVRNLESLAILKDHHLESFVVLDHNMYTFNRQAWSFFRAQGVRHNTAPLELNEHELTRRNNTESEMIVYGYLPMMVSAQCVKNNYSSCAKSDGTMEIIDRKNKKFTVQCYCNTCYNVIYNSVPMVLLKESEKIKTLGMKSLRLSFSIENYENTKEITRRYIARYLHYQSDEFAGEYTKGHYKRGIE